MCAPKGASRARAASIILAAKSTPSIVARGKRRRIISEKSPCADAEIDAGEGSVADRLLQKCERDAVETVEFRNESAPQRVVACGGGVEGGTDHFGMGRGHVGTFLRERGSHVTYGREHPRLRMIE